MKKNSFILFMLMLFVLPLFSQKAVKIDFKSTGKGIAFLPVIKQLTSEDKYMFNLPDRLTYYYNRNEIINSIFTATNAIGIKARYNDAKPDYIFEVQMSGIENVNVAPDRYHRDNYDGPKGFVKDITYNFPCSLVVKMKDGKEIKEIRKMEIFKRDAVFSTVYESGFFTGSFAPFGTQGVLDSSFTLNRDNIYKTLETRIATSAYAQICQALVYLFNEYNTSKMPYSYAGVKEKKRNFDFADIDKASADFQNALDLYFDEKKREAKKIFTTLIADYEKLLNTREERIDNNVKDMLRFNLSCSNMFLGNFSKAWEYFNAAKMRNIGEGDYYKRELRGLIAIYQFRSEIENSK